MLKQSVRAVAVLFSLITLAASVKAQSSHRFKVNVPFQFVLNGQTLPAGAYLIERLDFSRPNLVTIKNVDSGIVRTVITQRIEKNSPSASSFLVFKEQGGRQYLYQVWNYGALNGGQVPFSLDRRFSDRQREKPALVTLKARQ